MSYDDLTRVVVEATKLARIVTDHGQRLTALETARATAPVSDDEIVEALADADCVSKADGAWSYKDCTVKKRHRDHAEGMLERLRALRYDVVKRS